MPTAVFDYVEEPVKKQHADIDNKARFTLVEIGAKMREQKRQLEDGLWVGDAANAFYIDYGQFVLEVNDVYQMLTKFSDLLNKAEAKMSEVIQTNDDIINS